MISSLFYNFIIFFQKSIDKLKKILYDGKNWKGGDNIFQLIDFFLATFIIYLFTTLYSFYTFFDIVFFHNKQGSKLKIKKNLH